MTTVKTLSDVVGYIEMFESQALTTYSKDNIVDMTDAQRAQLLNDKNRFIVMLLTAIEEACTIMTRQMGSTDVDLLKNVIEAKQTVSITYTPHDIHFLNVEEVLELIDKKNSHIKHYVDLCLKIICTSYIMLTNRAYMTAKRNVDDDCDDDVWRWINPLKW